MYQPTQFYISFSTIYLFDLATKPCLWSPFLWFQNTIPWGHFLYHCVWRQLWPKHKAFKSFLLHLQSELQKQEKKFWCETYKSYANEMSVEFQAFLVLLVYLLLTFGGLFGLQWNGMKYQFLKQWSKILVKQWCNSTNHTVVLITIGQLLKPVMWSHCKFQGLPSLYLVNLTLQSFRPCLYEEKHLTCQTRGWEAR